MEQKIKVKCRLEKKMSDRLILITNDDGIEADGIEMLAKAAKQFGEVWVVAPEGQRSAASHRITYFSPIEAWEVDYPVEGVKAFACSGSPADCVRVAVKKILPRKPDFVFSGINYHFNASADIQYSATVGAAMEASFMKIPAIAFSREGCDCHETVDKYLPELMEKYMNMPLGPEQIWNINFPGCTLAECKGVLENRTVSHDDFYDDDYSETVLENGKISYMVTPMRNWEASEGTDLHALINNYVSVGVVKNIGVD